MIVYTVIDGIIVEVERDPQKLSLKTFFSNPRNRKLRYERAKEEKKTKTAT
jgi:hypothetical protein